MKYTYLKSALFLLVITLVSCNNQEEEPFAYGNFESEDVLVSDEVTGTIERFLIEEGDLVKAGQLIGVIDTSMLHLKKQQIIASGEAVRAKLLQIGKQIDVNNVNIGVVNRDLERVRAMHKQGAATDKQLDDLQGRVEVLRAQNAALQSQKTSVYAELDANKAQLAQTEDQINKCVLKSPRKGTILETYVRQGELAVTGRALYKIADLSTIILRAFIDGSQLSSIKPGDQVTVNYDGPDGKLLSKSGKVTWISSQAEFTPKIIQTRKERVNLVYAVKVKVPNDGSLKIGMPGEIAPLKQAE